MQLQIHHYHHSDDATQQLLNKLLFLATQNQTLLKELKVTDQQVSDLLDQVNATTNGIAAIQTADSTTLGTVKTELEALLANPTVNGISDATAAKLQTLATAIGGVKTNSDNNATLLNAIAAEGAPVVPPPPPPPAG
jgi:ABC-type transporter Mla subunit MlaD